MLPNSHLLMMSQFCVVCVSINGRLTGRRKSTPVNITMIQCVFVPTFYIVYTQHVSMTLLPFIFRLNYKTERPRYVAGNKTVRILSLCIHVTRAHTRTHTTYFSINFKTTKTEEEKKTHTKSGILIYVQCNRQWIDGKWPFNRITLCLRWFLSCAVCRAYLSSFRSFLLLLLCGIVLCSNGFLFLCFDLMYVDTEFNEFSDDSWWNT